MAHDSRLPIHAPALNEQENPTSSTGRSLRWGVVATGKIAATVTADISLLEDAVLHAVSSRTTEKANAFAARFGFAHAYADTGSAPGYRVLCQDPKVDVVYVAAPHGQHYEIVHTALEAGKHVLCEKSLTINASEARALTELAALQGVFLMEAVWSRFLPSLTRAWQIIRSGELGDIQWVQADLGFKAPLDPESRIWAPAAGGGALLDLAVYPLTWALGTLGFPDEVRASGHLNADGVDVQNALTLRYASGAHAQLTTSLVASSPRTATVCGSLGWLRTGAPLHHPLELTIAAAGDAEPRVERFAPVGNGYTYELREVTRCVQEGRTQSATMPLAHSIATMELFDDVRKQLGVRYPNDASVAGA